ncbi:hypothetical protein KR222_004026, partial [Zaprionus bogoriensis]
FGEFPWTVTVYAAYNVMYGGSLISANVVLTIASKLNPQTTPLRVRAGEWDRNSNKSVIPYQERLVDKSIPHPDYNSDNIDLNVALLIVASPFELMSHIRPIGLSNGEQPLDNSQCIVTGWNHRAIGGRWIVQSVNVTFPVASSEESDIYTKFKVIPWKYLKYSYGSALVCPLVNDSSNRYYQIGTWSIADSNNVSGIWFTNVTTVSKWIDGEL